MSSQRIVWSGFKPYYDNSLALSKPYNPVEEMGYVDFTSPINVIRGIGATVENGNITTIGLWSAEIDKDGQLGKDDGPVLTGSGNELGSENILPVGMVAVAWGMKSTNSKVVNIVIWARTWNSESMELEGDAKAFNITGSDDVDMLTPYSNDTQQIIVGAGAGVDDGKVNRISAGYATLGPIPESSVSQIIWGSVDENGKVISGINFDCNRSDTGVYKLQWKNNPDGVVPVVGLTSGLRDGEDGGSDNIFSFDKVKSTGCKVYSVDVGSKNKEPQDEAFSFVAFFPGSNIPGLLFGSVDESGDSMTGSDNWAPVYRDKGRYKIMFDPEMKPSPNIIVTSGTRSGEDGGSDCIISNTPSTPDDTYVFSLDVDGGNTKNEDQAFSFFAWNKNVLPVAPDSARAFAPVTSIRLGSEGELSGRENIFSVDGDRASTYSIAQTQGTGHWKVVFNFPVPELPIVYLSPVQNSSGESAGAKRIVSFANITTTSYEVWSTEVGNGKHKAADGTVEATVVLPDQFPI